MYTITLALFLVLCHVLTEFRMGERSEDALYTEILAVMHFQSRRTRTPLAYCIYVLLHHPRVLMLTCLRISSLGYTAGSYYITKVKWNTDQYTPLLPVAYRTVLRGRGEESSKTWWSMQ
jgi:hypothetical protein